MGFDPQTDKYPYPEYTDMHYLETVNYDKDTFGRDYPYIDRSRRFRIKRFFVDLLLDLIVFPAARVRLGLRIKGRDKLKKYRALLENGAITCSNHIHFWDYICVMRAVRPVRPYVLSWAPNLTGKDGNLVRAVGGIPIPESGVQATVSFLKTVTDLLDRKGWVHIYAEGSMWEYYRPIRPFKNGIGHIACATETPVFPMAFSYREPGWIRKHIFGQIALLTLNIGDPILPDPDLCGKDRETDLVRRAHGAVCTLAGIKPDENIYPPLFDHTARIDC